MKKLFWSLMGIGALGALAIFASSYFDFIDWVDQPLGETPETLFVDVKTGQGFDNIVQTLNNHGIPVDLLKFKLLARINGYDKQIKAGEYSFNKNISPRKLLQMLTEGQVNLYRLTIPEGFNIVQIGALVEEKGFCSAEDFLNALNDRFLRENLNIPATGFEGYLFPDTYHFPKKAQPPLIISTMVKRFWSVFTVQWQKRAQEIGFSVHEIVTLASIIEKETGEAAERPIISSVFHNRLKKGMRLETDPTVIYGIKNFDGNLTRKHLNTPTPYNTYRIKGLPPGPISSPGQKALEAALYPAETKYLFFVAKKDRTHHFSTNIRAHNRAVRKYQLK